ncbi:ABC transporter substrate-binding protein [Paenibacillus taichungensis]|uniref:ABC transporter substrate-binding protein n=1 Tax=Paenibacillus taichungensis TaxID=484184 RepID=A0ABX2MNP1_9BACL|nr:ABC transporter substrate-binding protein [Paenibacillus taichungensis]OME82727.1 ABC transporter [Paenibacillus pabuli]MDR9746401.1 ABC transporter substrate-binding protein [Paenibacillus taichungensis]MEC0111334.1 ABC transporter substrate-binding protein [Paenibacillus taichungensis]MEC0198893.1 ABC transporter substrate-binding protein [Paenibacillus taichungensis]NUU55691.1 ABC transporter substrate-binding protein [Paenibacillus taichungensis]
MNSTLMKQLTIWGASFLLLAVLAACSRSESIPSQELEENREQTISYTTQSGEQVEIPAQSQRVIYLGSTLEDLLAMDIPVVGANLVHATGSYTEGRLEGIEDVGNPGDLEAIAALQPDLILNGYTEDADRNTAFAKIAPTIPFNSALPFKERVRELGTIFDKKDEAEKWITKFDAKSELMWDKLQLEDGETATIFLQLGKKLYVMGNRSLGVVLYQERGFAIPPAIQQNIIAKDQTFIEVSEELLPEYAGDHLFVLVLGNDESQAESDRMMQSPLWQTLPAVQNGNVYTTSAEWNTDNLLALEQLLDELPKWMNR